MFVRGFRLDNVEDAINIWDRQTPLKENVLIAGHVFDKNSELLSYQLYKNKC